MTAAILSDPFVLHTFIETRGNEPYRVFHPIGTDDSWIPKSRLYQNHLQQTMNSPTKPYPHDKNASLRNAVIQTECWPDRFLIFADRDALERHHQVIPNTVWWACPNAEGAFWIRMHPGDIKIVNFPSIPEDHRDTVRHTVRDIINLHPLPRILAELQNDYDLPDFLMSIQDDILEYEATILLPKADTVEYNRLRDELGAV